MKGFTASLLGALLVAGSLSALPASAMDSMSQQDKMKMCNKDATGKKGDDRKAFMSDCLKG